jgi:hypothetical protein
MVSYGSSSYLSARRRIQFNKRLQRTRHERASLVSCVGEPLKRNVGR